MTSALTVWAPGIPVTQGSKNRDRHGRMYDAKHRELRWWRDLIALQTVRARRGALTWSGPVQVRLAFLLPRPPSHRRADGRLTPSAPRLPVSRHDLDKLTRAVFDALTASQVWGDDGQVVGLVASKSYAQDPQVQPWRTAAMTGEEFQHASHGLNGPGVAITLTPVVVGPAPGEAAP